jgi:hypothetical protein
MAAPVLGSTNFDYGMNDSVFSLLLIIEVTALISQFRPTSSTMHVKHFWCMKNHRKFFPQSYELEISGARITFILTLKYLETF